MTTYTKKTNTHTKITIVIYKNKQSTEVEIFKPIKPKLKFLQKPLQKPLQKSNQKTDNYYDLYSEIKSKNLSPPNPMRGDFYYDLKTKKYIISDPTGYYVSEKLDGVRAIWDPPYLKTRYNKILPAPQEFLDNFPSNMMLDGELYIKRNYFPQTLSAVRSHSTQVWLTQIKYYVFDIPDSAPLPFETVQKILHTSIDSPYIIPIQQTEIKSRQHLQEYHHNLIKQGAEGTMLRKPNTPYTPGPQKTINILKYKGILDPETNKVKHVLDELVEVIGYKYDPTRNNRIKSIWVRWQDKDKYPNDPTFAVYHNLTREQLNNAKTLFPITTILRITFNEIFPSSQKPRYPRFDSIHSKV